MKAFALTALLLLAGCGGADPAADPEPPENAAMPKASPPATAVDLEEKDDLLTWSLSYPAEVAAIPALATRIRAAADRERAEAIPDAREQKEMREKDGFDFPGFEQSNSYSVAGSTPRLLSLSNDWFVYSGGAHPMHGTRPLLWDREAGREVALANLLSGGLAALAPLYARAYCAELDKQRLEKRGPDESAGGPDDPFNDCPDFADLSIIPQGPDKGGPMTRLLFHADPYVAGPYVEGDYDVELPVSAAFVAALKPEYRSSFAAAR